MLDLLGRVAPQQERRHLPRHAPADLAIFAERHEKLVVAGRLRRRRDVVAHGQRVDDVVVERLVGQRIGGRPGPRLVALLLRVRRHDLVVGALHAELGRPRPADEIFRIDRAGQMHVQVGALRHRLRKARSSVWSARRPEKRAAVTHVLPTQPQPSTNRPMIAATIRTSATQLPAACSETPHENPPRRLRRGGMLASAV